MSAGTGVPGAALPDATDDRPNDDMADARRLNGPLPGNSGSPETAEMNSIGPTGGKAGSCSGTVGNC